MTRVQHAVYLRYA